MGSGHRPLLTGQRTPTSRSEPPALRGPRTLEPSATPVDLPAAFTFTAGARSGDTGTITLEQRSKRGIGRKTLEFEVEVEEHAVVVSIVATADWAPDAGPRRTVA